LSTDGLTNQNEDLMINRSQIRMARAALGWGVRDLAREAGLATATVARIESGKEAMGSSLRKIRKTLEDAGCDFPDDYTVACRRLADREEWAGQP
jgi:transcriptional regulator with XRE-family HTH domain